VRLWIRAHANLLCVLLAGLVVRLALLPWWHGQDFTVWRLATEATLRGRDIFTDPPNYPGGPYAYFPLFLYLELPFRWLADHSAAPFLVLGKLVTVAADLAVGALIEIGLRRCGASKRRAALGCALFLFDPLVLYNSAYYGRFDSLAVALLLAATFPRRAASDLPVARAASYAFAVAAKTFPIVALPAMFTAARRRSPIVLVAVVVVPLALSIPFLSTPGPFIHELLVYDLSKAPTGMSWWVAIDPLLHGADAWRTSLAVLIALLAGSCAIAWRGRDDLTWAIVASLLLFTLCSKLVLEQYLTWPLPWLVLLGLGRPGRMARASLLLAALTTVAGMLDSESFHPFGRNAAVIAVPLAVAEVAYLLVTSRMVGRIRPTGGADRVATLAG
jgi:hypothetical protein